MQHQSPVYLVSPKIDTTKFILIFHLYVCEKNTQPTAAFTEIAMLVLLDKLKVGQRRRVALEDFTNKMMNSQKHHHELGRTG